MGTGTSRGKRVAPALDGEVSRTAAGVASPKRDSGVFKPLKIQSILRNARNRAPPDRHSDGPDSEPSGEEDNTDAELDAVLAAYEERERVSVKTCPPRKTLRRSRTYGLCHFGREDNEDDSCAAPEEPRVPHGAGTHVNKNSRSAFTQPATHTAGCPTPHHDFLTRTGAAAPNQLTASGCHASSLATPVILYDGSEEELMDTIEREFS